MKVLITPNSIAPYTVLKKLTAESVAFVLVYHLSSFKRNFDGTKDQEQPGTHFWQGVDF